MLFVIQAHSTNLCALPTHITCLFCRLTHVWLYCRLIQCGFFVLQTHTTCLIILQTHAACLFVVQIQMACIFCLDTNNMSHAYHRNTHPCIIDTYKMSYLHFRLIQHMFIWKTQNKCICIAHTHNMAIGFGDSYNMLICFAHIQHSFLCCRIMWHIYLYFRLLQYVFIYVKSYNMAFCIVM